MVQMEQKTFANKNSSKLKKKCAKGIKKFSWTEFFVIEQKMFAMKIAPNRTENRWFKIILQVFLAICGHTGPRPIVVLHGLLRSCVAFYSLVWPFYGPPWLCIVFSRGHRSKFIWSCLWYWRSLSRQTYRSRQ